MLTEAQKIIVEEVCSIQFTSLSDILIQIDLGKDDDGDDYIAILEELGFNRADFDKELIDTIDIFKKVQENPELVFELEELDIIVFRSILHLFREKWEDRFPKAIMNLWHKLLISEIGLELHNLN